MRHEVILLSMSVAPIWLDSHVASLPHLSCCNCQAFLLESARVGPWNSGRGSAERVPTSGRSLDGKEKKLGSFRSSTRLSCNLSLNFFADYIIKDNRLSVVRLSDLTSSTPRRLIKKTVHSLKQYEVTCQIRVLKAGVFISSL